MPRKAINLVLYFVLSWVYGPSALAQSPNPPPKTLSYEDFAHPHKGCPENSECDETMGQLLGEWKKLAEGWSEAAPQAKLQQMRTALARGGWPIEFLAKSAVSTGLRPALFSSQCSEHNPKDGPLHKIWRAQAFAKGVEDGQIVFTRGDTEFKIRPGELIQLRPVIIHPEGAPAVEYWLPLDETPLYWEKNKLSLIVESEGNYALLTIPANGKWEVSLPPESDTSVYLEDRTDVACPKTAKGSLRPWFQHTHCQKILNKDSGKTVIAQFYQSC